MIFVFHGENQPALREELLKMKKGYDESRYVSDDLKSLPSYLKSPLLLGKRELVVVEDPDFREVRPLLKLPKVDKDVLLLFPRELKAGELKRFKGAAVKRFPQAVPKTVFPFLDALAGRKKEKALLEARRLIRGGADVDYLLKMISWQFRNLLRVKDGFAEGINPYVAKKLKRFTKYWETEELKRIFSHVLKEDLRLKKGKKTPLDFLINEILK
ncbi:hypothetical protein GTO10_02310 [Candidatus Saccharibacteria bacterium]|nr:hypothetical protein [Candidatus Saccharibacteria bacterium]